MKARLIVEVWHTLHTPDNIFERDLHFLFRSCTWCFLFVLCYECVPGKMFLISAIAIAAWYVKRQRLVLKRVNTQLVSEKQILSGVAVSQAFWPICNSHIISVKGTPTTEDVPERFPVLVICCLDVLHDQLDTISSIQCWDGLLLSLLWSAGIWGGAH